MADKPRKPSTPHGFNLELGTADDVAVAGEIGSFLGLKLKSDLEKDFAAFLGGQNVLAAYLESLRARARAKLDGPQKRSREDGMPTAGEQLDELKRRAGLTPDGGIPIVLPGSDKGA